MAKTKQKQWLNFPLPFFPLIVSGMFLSFQFSVFGAHQLTTFITLMTTNECLAEKIFPPPLLLLFNLRRKYFQTMETNFFVNLFLLFLKLLRCSFDKKEKSGRQLIVITEYIHIMYHTILSVERRAISDNEWIKEIKSICCSFVDFYLHFFFIFLHLITLIIAE